MKKNILLSLMFITLFSYAQTKKTIKKPTLTKPVTSKYGSLAIDRNNGFYYGWAFDYPTLAEAEIKAIEECIAKGGNCTTVLSYSGTGCAAYRTSDSKVGDAFGWGLAKTKEEADAIAIKEYYKRSNGNQSSNYVWSCNSLNSGSLKEIYNAKDEIEISVRAGNQVWSNKNLNVNTFRNGDLIPEAKNVLEWQQFCIAQKPCSVNLNFDPKNSRLYGKLYNFYAVKDKRGLAPSGWHIPEKHEYQELIDYLGGATEAFKKMRAKSGWKIINTKRDIGNGTNESGLSFVSGGYASDNEYDKSLSVSYVFSDKYIDTGWWTATNDPSTIGNGWVFKFYSQGITAISASEYPTRGFSVRCLKN